MREREWQTAGITCRVRKNKRARKLRITLSPDGRCVVTLPPFVSYKQGQIFLASQTEWLERKVQALRERPRSILGQGGPEEYRTLKLAARVRIEERLVHFQKFYSFRWKRVSIRNQQTRWGSCSRNGNLSFNYRLIFLPPHLSDYVIVHELCHLLEFNHSPRFWSRVIGILPDAFALRRELRFFSTV